MKTTKEIEDAVKKLWDIDPKVEKTQIMLIRETLEWVLGDTTLVDDVIEDFSNAKEE